MEVIAPDILADVRLLSAVFSVAAILAGLVLWLVGWWTHRFWVVLGLTVAGGVWGLQHAAELRTTPLLAAIGVGLASGLLALTVVRLGAFFAGGFAVLALARAWWPEFDAPLACFLAGGLVGWFLFRYWTMALTSLAGVVLMVYGALAILDKLDRLDAVAFSEQRVILINTLVGLLALGGLVTQVSADWLRGRLAKKDEDKDDDEDDQPVPVAAFRKAG
jgi:MFS family permease